MTPKHKALIPNQTKGDSSRLPEHKVGPLKTTVSVDPMAENTDHVKEPESRGEPRAYDLVELREIMRHLGAAPDSQIDGMFTKRIREELPPDIDLEGMLNFIRDLRDECVFCGGANDFVMFLFGCLLEGYPETEEAKKTRRAELERKYGL